MPESEIALSQTGRIDNSGWPRQTKRPLLLPENAASERTETPVRSAPTALCWLTILRETPALAVLRLCQPSDTRMARGIRESTERLQRRCL
jgi:hypothetical protein